MAAESAPADRLGPAAVVVAVVAVVAIVAVVVIVVAVVVVVVSIFVVAVLHQNNHPMILHSMR